MKLFIKLHDFKTGDPGLVSVKEIMFVGSYESGSKIILENGRACEVMESVGEIHKMMLQDLSGVRISSGNTSNV